MTLPIGSVRVKASELGAAMRRDLTSLRGAVRHEAKMSCKFGLNYIKNQTVPVDTGLLRSTGRLENDGLSIVFGGTRAPFNAFYAYFVEHGTSRMRPRHYMARAMPIISQNFEKRLLKLGIR